MASEEGQVIDIHTIDEWKEHFLKGAESKKLVVVDFTASWCGPCRFIAPYFADLAKQHTNAIFLKVDVDELTAVAQEFEVNAMPTFVFLKEGKQLHKLVGAAKLELGKLVMEFSARTSIA